MAFAPPDSTETEVEALNVLCERLRGFGADVDAEYLDGWLTALACTPRRVPRDEWLPLFAGDSFERAYADPQDAAVALAALEARERVLGQQLLPEALDDDPDQLRLLPLMVEWDEATRAEAVADGVVDADEAAQELHTGVFWAQGFRDALRALPADWPEPRFDDGAADEFGSLLAPILALMFTPEQLAEHVAESHAGRQPSREELVDDACWAVQDLVLHMRERAVQVEPRRVEPRPGRNDPCPCGSGRKYKKCHGA